MASRNYNDSIANSSSTALTSNASFTGGWVDVREYASVSVAAKSDAAGTLYVDFADTSTGPAQSTLSYAVAAGINDVHRLTVTRPWCRVRYTNGSTAQSNFSLQTLFGVHPQITSPLNGTLQQDADAIAVRTIDSENDIAEGKRQGYAAVNKFGRNPDIDTGTVPEDVWGGGGVYTGFPTGAAELVTVVSTSVNDTAAGSGARTVRIMGLDANGAEQHETITLNGTTPADSANTYTRVNRMYVLTSGSSNSAFNAGTLTAAHKVTTANIFSVMAVGTNRGETCCYTIPAGKTGYLRYIEVMLDTNTTAAAQGALWIRPYGASPYLYKAFSLTNNDEHMQYVYGGITLTALTDVAVRITQVSTNNVVAHAHFDLILVDN